MECKELTVEELRSKVTKLANWKSPGPDTFSDIFKNPEHAPEWLVEG